MTSLTMRISSSFFMLSLLFAFLFVFPASAFFTICVVLQVVAAFEWRHFFTSPNLFWGAALLSLVLAADLLFHFSSHGRLILGFFGLGVYFLAFTCVILYQFQRPVSWLKHNVIIFIFGFVTIVSSFDAIQRLFMQSTPGIHSPWWLMYCLLLVFVTDSVAYLAGSKWGKKKFMSIVSPKKTWVGFCSSFIAVLLLTLVVSFTASISATHFTAFYLSSFLCFVFSVFGDLSISLFKRIREIKDMGSIIPGHGGLLDRFDSIMPACLVFYVTMSRLHCF